MDGVALKGLERVISVTIGSSTADEAGEALQNAAGGKGKAVESLIGGLNRNPNGGGDYEEDKSLPVVHFRTYNVHFMRSGVPTPRVELSPHGPHFTFSLRRSQKPAQEVWKLAMKKKEKKATSTKPKNKNIDVSFNTFLYTRHSRTDMSLSPDQRDGRQDRTSSRRPSRSFYSADSQVQGTQEAKGRGRSRIRGSTVRRRICGREASERWRRRR